MTAVITAQDLRRMLQDDDELALLDVREEGVFGRSHLLFAVNLPLSRLELRLYDLVPRRTTRIVLCDGGEGLATRAAAKLAALGYTDLAVLDGGAPAWKAAGYELFGGVNVPSKAFGEFVEHHSGTPSVSAQELKAMMDRGEKMTVLDSRPWTEYRRMNIPTGIDCPGAELVYRVNDIVRDPDTTVVVNCAGRTRSIIGAQSLINGGLPNKVVALRNGTMGWSLAGFTLETGGQRRFPDPTPAGAARAREAAARVASRYGVKTIDMAGLARWRGDKDRTLYLLDVRNPEEYEAGHMPGSISAPGGQLVQATDRYVGTMRSRLVLIDDNGVRATMTASWLIQMGWTDVAVLQGGLAGALERGTPKPVVPGLEAVRVETVDVPTLGAMLERGTATVVDLATSLEYRDAGHIPGAWWAIRARLETSLGKVPGDGTLVFTSPDGVLATLAAGDASRLTGRAVKLLAGGTAAWRAAGKPLATGFENLTDIYNDDILYRAYDYTENIEAHMKEYLSWETGLVEQIERDGTARFRHIPVP